MKNKYKILSVIMLFLLFLGTQCGKDEDKVLGPNEMKSIEVTEPSIIADGISSVTISAVVYDTSGYPAQGIPVFFTTTHGTITRYAITTSSGEARATLTSVASKYDLDAIINATIQDSGSLKKTIPQNYKIILKPDQPGTLKKSASSNSLSGELLVKFVGVTLTAKLDKTDIPADGINSAVLEIVVKETTLKKAVSNANIFLRAVHNNIPSVIVTNDMGLATASLLSLKSAMVDTIFIDYGNFTSNHLLLNYVIPKLSVSPQIAQLSADGKSRLYITARLLSHQNNPIVGGLINFTTSQGSITASQFTNDRGDAIAELVSSTLVSENVQVIASFNNIADTAKVSFVESAGQSMFSLTGQNVLIRNGIAEVVLQATLLDDQQAPITDTKLKFHANYGKVDTVAVTNDEGIAQVKYIADADSLDATDIVTATFGSLITNLPINLLGVNMAVSANPDSIQADGIASAKITVQLKLTTLKEVIPKAVINFNSNLGSIPNEATTDIVGTARAELLSETTPGIAQVNIFYGGIHKSLPIIFASENPTTILLEAEPNFIWVKETGNLEQTTLIARVLSQTGTPVANDLSVIFTVLNGPGGGESIFPAKAGSTRETVPIKTVNGEAKATLKSGTRSGTVQIQAEVVGENGIIARTTNVVIRSGPPYMWIDPANKNHVESHMTIAFDYVNQDGWSNVRNYDVTVYVGDRYNNPVEEGTTVYLTTTAGIITTDVKTDANGIGKAMLRSANPRPVLQPGDPYVLAPHRIPNPNDSNLMLDIQVPDFEFSEVVNTLGNMGENDGMAYVLARTQGCDQFLHQSDQSDSTVMVFTYGGVIFSGPLLEFRVTKNVDTLKIGQAAFIEIRAYDLNGNPVAQGSTLTASSSKGRLSQTTFMPSPEKYGIGSTRYSTYFLNNLDPANDKSGIAEITFNLESPNGSASSTIFIYLLVED